MKIHIIIFSIVVLFSCSTTNDSNLKQADQKYQLVKMTGNFVGSETVGESMQWQESYELKSDNTFIKIRQENNTTNQASGTYKYVELADGIYLEFTYASNNNLIGSCTGNKKEFLRVISRTLLRGTWQACDGPGLEYELK